MALASLCGAGAVAFGRAEKAAPRRRGASVAARAEGAGLATAERPDFARSRKTRDIQDGEEDDLDWNEVSEDWEVDCFSRPIVRDGKKIWELMVTDANGMYRRVAQMKPTRVNSVVVQKLITIFIEEAKVKPRSIRFFRKVMKNMLTVSLTTMKEQIPYLSEMKVLPSRNCHMMRLWLDYREREVYPKMSGYAPVAKRRAQSVQAGQMQISYTDLPKKLRFPSYAVSAIPLGALAAVKPGTLPGQICRIPPGFDDTNLVHGIVINSPKADILTNLLRTQELAAIRLDTDSGELLIDLGIDSTYRIWEVPQEDKETIIQFERAKRAMSGFHFVAIHNPQFGLQPELPYEDEDGYMDLSKCTIAGLWLCMDYAPRDAQ